MSSILGRTASRYLKKSSSSNFTKAMAIQTILVCCENCPVFWMPWLSGSEKPFGKPVVELLIGSSFVSLARRNVDNAEESALTCVYGSSEDGGNRRDICCRS